MLLTITSMVGAFYFSFQRENHISFSTLWLKYGGYKVDSAILSEAVNKAQGVYFFNLVICQWFNLLSTRTRRLSIFQQSPIGNEATRNIRLFPAMAIALLIAVLYVCCYT